jgi:hypothetical protein
VDKIDKQSQVEGDLEINKKIEVLEFCAILGPMSLIEDKRIGCYKRVKIDFQDTGGGEADST